MVCVVFLVPTLRQSGGGSLFMYKDQGSYRISSLEGGGGGGGNVDGWKGCTLVLVHPPGLIDFNEILDIFKDKKHHI